MISCDLYDQSQPKNITLILDFRCCSNLPCGNLEDYYALLLMQTFEEFGAFL